MTWPRRIALALLSHTLPPESASSADTPLAAGVPDVQRGPVAPVWTRREAHVHATALRLNRLGIRTHANWAFFRLPFAATDRDRIRGVRFAPHLATDSAVGALRIGSVCIITPSEGGIDAWAVYTTTGIGGTERFRWHPAPPTADPTVVAINVPTRVANYIACGLDEGHLLDREGWTLDIAWEER